MKDRGRAACAVLAILLLLTPVAYVGGEGIFYAATGEIYFPEGTTYRRLYAPLDAVSRGWPPLWGVRENLARGWFSLRGEEGSTWVIVAPLPPVPVYLCPSDPYFATP